MQTANTPATPSNTLPGPQHNLRPYPAAGAHTSTPQLSLPLVLESRPLVVQPLGVTPANRVSPGPRQADLRLRGAAAGKDERPYTPLAGWLAGWLSPYSSDRSVALCAAAGPRHAAGREAWDNEASRAFRLSSSPADRHTKHSQTLPSAQHRCCYVCRARRGVRLPLLMRAVGGPSKCGRRCSALMRCDFPALCYPHTHTHTHTYLTSLPWARAATKPASR
jgi:hypothetical protein